MAQLIDIVKVEVGPRTLVATVHLTEDAPLMTSEDLEGTTRVYRLMPGIIDHACIGDAGDTFRDVMGNTELAHLLEHATVELLAQSNMAGDISSGRTRLLSDDGRTFEIELACPDDVLVCGALSSACWMLEWAYSGGEGPEPDVEATVQGLVGLVQSLPVPDLRGERDVASPGEGADATARGARPQLQLVGDDGQAAATDRLGATDVSRIQGAARVESTSSEGHPGESPEARQAAADMPGPATVSVSSGSAGSTRRRTSPSSDTPLPMPAGRRTSPSVTADLPTSTTIR